MLSIRRNRSTFPRNKGGRVSYFRFEVKKNHPPQARMGGVILRLVIGELDEGDAAPSLAERR